MQLLSTLFTAALSAAGNHGAIAKGVSKRTTWYPAFSEKAAWSSIG